LIWTLEKNILPEAEYDEKAKKTKQRLDAGGEVLKILRDAGFKIPGANMDDDEMSVYRVESTYVNYFEDSDEECADEECADENDGDEEDERDLYCEGLMTFMDEEFFPYHGTRPGAVWHAASPEALKLMIEAGADVNAADAAGWTAMHHIAFDCDFNYYFNPDAMLQILIDAGADVNARGRYDLTPLCLAGMRVRQYPRALETVKLLLRNVADFNAPGDNGSGVLYWVRDYWYANGMFEKMILQEILFEIYRSAQPDEAKRTAGDERETPAPLSAVDADLMTAAFWGAPEDIASALARGANINARSENGYAPLIFASVWNHAPAVKFLIERGADMNAKNTREETAFELAIMTRDFPVIEALVEAGASLAETNKWGVTPLMTLVDHIIDEDLVQLFIDSGADVNAKDNDGQTALMRVAMNYLPDTGVANVLIEAGADVNARDDEGRTALEIALALGENDRHGGEFVGFLLSKGANPSLMPIEKPLKKDCEDDYEQQLSEMLSKFGLKPRSRFADVFADNGADEIAAAVRAGLPLSAKDADMEEFFTAALRYGAAEVMRACVDSGGNVNERWSGGDWINFKHFPTSYPLYKAIEAHNADAAEVLLEAGAEAGFANELNWHERLNIFPEGDGAPAAKKLQARLAAGAKILRLLNGGDLTYVSVDYRKDDAYRSGDADEPAAAVALRRAASPEALKLLIAEGNDVNARGRGGATAAHWIARDYAEYFEPNAMLRILLEAGADADARDDEGVTPLMLLAGHILNHPRAMDAVKLLIASGADIGAIDSKRRSVRDRIGGDGCGALEKTMIWKLVDAACRAFGKNEAGKPNAVKKEDADLLIAAHHGSAGEIESALSRGAGVNARSGGGYTPLMFASAFNSAEAVRLLIARGAKVGARNSRKSGALHIAALSGRSAPEAVRALIDAGADVNARDNGGNTPLILAARARETEEIPVILIKAGADVDAKNKKGETALTEAAAERPHFGTARALLAAGADWNGAFARKSEDEVLKEDNGETGDISAQLRGFGLNV
jgi:ankyrin repeat protein